MLAELEGVGDVADELGVVEQEVHRVLHALDPDRQRDVVVPAQERQPQLPAMCTGWFNLETDHLLRSKSLPRPKIGQDCDRKRALRQFWNRTY